MANGITCIEWKGMTKGKRQQWRMGLKFLALLGLALGCIGACWQEISGSQCFTPPQLANCANGCTNFYGHPQIQYCDYRDDPPTGFENCTNSTVTCFKVLQVSTCYLAGQGPHPEFGTNYCWNPGPQINIPVGTTTKAHGWGSCPGS